jgi:hypothetical protein
MESATVDVVLLRGGFVHGGIARAAGSRISVDQETFGRLLSLGFVREPIQVRARIGGFLAGDRVLAVGEVGTAPEGVALGRYFAFQWDIVNPQSLSSALPARRRQRLVAVEVAPDLMRGGVAKWLVYGPSDMSSVTWERVLMAEDQASILVASGKGRLVPIEEPAAAGDGGGSPVEAKSKRPR